MSKLLLSMIVSVLLLVSAENWSNGGLSVMQVLGSVLATGKMMIPGRN